MDNIKVMVNLPVDLNEMLLDEVARVRKDTGIRISKERVIINLIEKEFKDGNNCNKNGR